ncbi:MAG: ATP-binding cassette domain-containing protein [Gammaproteobacteria bacterium]|nr:ATP-binding cassette domain-containing protein [Gammaproteobacteria bacterium]
MIKASNISFTLPSGTTLINDVSFEIAAHDFVILLGSNGSGKSTIIKMLNRQYVPTSGKILLDNQDLGSISHQQFSEDVITLTQFVRDSLFFDLTIAENAILIEGSYYKNHKQRFNKKQFLDALKEYLANFNTKLATSLNTPLFNLSGGEQQILAFALYLRHQPKLLLLDEHTSALDPKMGQTIMNFTAKIIHEKKLTCIMTTHNLDHALNYGNRLIALNNGQIVFSSDTEKKETITKEILLEKCY